MDKGKPHVQAFVLFPEPEKQHFYMKDDIGFQSEEFLRKFLLKINACKSLIEIENYQGYYDAENVEKFIQHYHLLEEYYPSKPSRLLRSQLKAWDNWRDERFSIEENECTLLGCAISNDSFTELVVRSREEENNRYIIVSHHALHIPTGTIHQVEFESKTYPVACIELANLPSWFSDNRMPQRNYHPSPKHGENGVGEWKDASRLLCSHNRAGLLLLRAIGSPELDELYLFDEQPGKFITFRYEGDNTLNQYHAYHLENENEVPTTIKKLHIKLCELTRDV